MSQNDENPDPIPSPDYQKEGEQVTGGSEKDQTENTETTSTDDQESEKGEYKPSTETTKEEMTGYNELPEQDKVGGA